MNSVTIRVRMGWSSRDGCGAFLPPSRTGGPGYDSCSHILPGAAVRDVAHTGGGGSVETSPEGGMVIGGAGAASAGALLRVLASAVAVGSVLLAPTAVLRAHEAA